MDSAGALPLECQELLLAVAKGMAFTNACLAKAAKESKPQENA